MIYRGYDRRHRQMWGAIRWQTYHMMCAFAGSDALKKAGINSVKDLLQFPWEVNSQHISDEDIQDLVREMDAINAQSSEY